MFSKLLRKKIVKIVGNRFVLFNKNLFNYTSFRIGGPVDVLVFPRNFVDLLRLIEISIKFNIKFIVLGGCSNVLVCDDGIRGLVIIMSSWSMNFFYSTFLDDRVVLNVGAGVDLKNICAYSIKNNLSGLNFALGIPGTVGGAIFSNLSTNNGCIFEVLENVTFINNAGKIVNVSTFKNGTLFLQEWAKKMKVILWCKLSLKRIRSINLKLSARTIIKSKINSQPMFLHSAGCFFKNPIGCLSAGNLIDRIGLKGKMVGRAVVSKVHANYIVNVGGATACDVLKLSDLVRESVYKNFKIELVPEVRMIN